MVKATARCCSCSALLLSRPFFLFSCSHAFHTDCLVEAVLPHLTPARQRRVRELQTVLDQPEPDTASLDSRSVQGFSGERKVLIFCLANIYASTCTEAEAYHVLAFSQGKQVKRSIAFSLRSATPDKRREAETELEDLVASECLLCGDIMVINTHFHSRTLTFPTGAEYRQTFH